MSKVSVSCRHTLRMLGHDGRELAAVFVGGALGTVARVLLAMLAAPDPGRWPWPTFIANAVGALLLGYFTTRLLERLPVSQYRRPLLGTGFCGGLTTYSAFAVQTRDQGRDRGPGAAAAYAVATIGISLAACALGFAIGQA